MSSDAPAIGRLDNKLTALAILLGALAYFVMAAQHDAEKVREQLLDERARRRDAEDARDRARADLDGALERLHETAGERDELRARRAGESE